MAWQSGGGFASGAARAVTMTAPGPAAVGRGRVLPRRRGAVLSPRTHRTLFLRRPPLPLRNSTFVLPSFAAAASAGEIPGV